LRPCFREKGLQPWNEIRLFLQEPAPNFIHAPQDQLTRIAVVTGLALLTPGHQAPVPSTETHMPIGREALDRIALPYAVEKTINGLPAERHRQQRQLQSKPIAEALAAWAAHTVPQLSRKPELAQAFRYMRAR
jgi:Transposase IS66 family